MEQELLVPPVATEDPQSYELVRLWFSEKHGCEISLRTGSLPVGFWGVMIADLIGHLANSYEAQGVDPDDVVNEILTFLHLEASSPSDQTVTLETPTPEIQTTKTGVA